MKVKNNAVLLVLGIMILLGSGLGAQTFDARLKYTLPNDTVALESLWVNDKSYTEFALWFTNTGTTDTIAILDYSALAYTLSMGGKFFLPPGKTDSSHFEMQLMYCVRPGLTYTWAGPVPNPDNLKNSVIKKWMGCPSLVSIIDSEAKTPSLKPSFRIRVKGIEYPVSGTLVVPYRNVKGAMHPGGDKIPSGVQVLRNP